jgi:tetrahydromethanopterin S-methyltransferase subunit B
MVIKIRVFRASEDEESSHLFVEGHRKVLDAYGVTKVTSNKENWIGDPNTYVIVAETKDSSRILGGARVQVRSQEIKMPMEDAIAKIDPQINHYVDAIGNYKVAELCGLFNSKEVAGYGIGSIFLGRVGMVVASQIGIDKLMALCSPATLRNCFRVGFEILRELGLNGKFYYPKEGLIATALILNDIVNLPAANPEEREKIFNLRQNPNCTILETGPKGELEINYKTNID